MARVKAHQPSLDGFFLRRSSSITDHQNCGLKIMDTSGKEAPEVLASEDVFRGRIFTVSVDTVREGDKTHVREIVRHPGSAAIVAVAGDSTVMLVRQYRHPAVRYVLEVP